MSFLKVSLRSACPSGKGHPGDGCSCAHTPQKVDPVAQPGVEPGHAFTFHPTFHIEGLELGQVPNGARERRQLVFFHI